MSKYNLRISVTHDGKYWNSHGAYRDENGNTAIYNGVPVVCFCANLMSREKALKAIYEWAMISDVDIIEELEKEENNNENSN